MRRDREKPLFEQQPMPHDLDTENAVLATLIRYNEKYPLYSDLLCAELFYHDKEKAIYRCVEGIINQGGMTDINSLYNYAQSNDVGYQVERFDFVNIISMVSRETIEQDIRRLRDFTRRRICWKMLMQASVRVLDLTLDLDEEINSVMASLNELLSEMGDEKVTGFKEAIKKVNEVAEKNQRGEKQCLTTGFSLFDSHYLLRPQTLTIIAAFPAVGKSALALNIVMALARQGIGSAYYSLEMDSTELVSRAISEDVGLPSYVIMNKPLSQQMADRFQMVAEKNKNLPIYFDDRSTVSFERVMRSIRTMVKTKGIKLAVIDYLQIFNQTVDDEEQGMSYMARACKNIAKETGIAVIALSQLNRSAAHPSLRALRGSGQIEESADNVVLIDRPEAYPDNKVTKYEGEFKDCSIEKTAKLILAKGRGVGTGCSLVAFNGKYTKFSEIEKPADAGHYEEQTEDLPF